ncbi:MAG: hypothetical protein M5U26_08215 [Planctomycetota bacterium]|nr:hypothetical protein [Planctomycetota bacterium]
MSLKHWIACLGLVLAAALAARASEDLVKPLAAMDRLEALGLTEGSDAELVAEGPNGETVLCGGQFALNLDLKKLGVDAREFDLLKLQIKADARAHLNVSLENYPRPGDLAHWYAFSGTHGAFGWRTLWIDLRRPEEIKPAGSYKGMENADPEARGLQVRGNIGQRMRSADPQDGSIWIGSIRLVREAVHLDWDMSQAPFTGGQGQDLVYTYPIAVTNRLDRPLEAVLKTVPYKVQHATAALSPERVALQPKETRTIQARVTLPADVAAREKPLYCERFILLASAEGCADSEVSLLRSSDLLYLTATVPIPEEQLAFPFLTRRKDVPELTGMRDRERAAEAQAEAAKPEDLDASMGTTEEASWFHELHGKRGLYPWGKNGAFVEAGWRYLNGSTACAFLYDLTGEKKYLDKGTALLAHAAGVFAKYRQAWAAGAYGMISDGCISQNTLRLGWATGSMRAPYVMDKHGLFNDFDLLAKDMDPAARKTIVEGFLVPAAVQMAGHRFGLSNQQDVVNYPIVYAGMAARNWALVSLAYSGDYGLLTQLEKGFDDEGLCTEAHYQVPSLRPILYATELLYHRGIDLYDQRLWTILHSRAYEAMSGPYRDAIAAYVDEHRFKGKAIEKPKEDTDGLHLPSGLTNLRWKGFEAVMNWGAQLHRSAPDRCALGFAVRDKKHPLAGLDGVGGGNYTKCSLGQSILIVDEGLQNAAPAEIVAMDLNGPVQFIQARSEKHFPGTAITRTFALVDQLVLTFDRAQSDAPRVYDWCLHYRGGNFSHEALAKGFSVPAERKEGSFTEKEGLSTKGVDFGKRLKNNEHYFARTDGDFGEARCKPPV